MADPVVVPGRTVFVPLAERASLGSTAVRNTGMEEDAALAQVSSTAPLPHSHTPALLNAELRVDPPHSPAAETLRPSGRLAVFLEQLQAELDERSANLALQAEQLRADQLAWRHQQATQRDELLMLRSQLNDDCSAVAQEQARLAGEEQRIQERVDLQLQADRQALWENLSQEWEVRRTAFEVERDAWDAECAALRQQIDTERTRYEHLIAGWEQEHSRRQADLAQELHDRRLTAEDEWAAEVEQRQRALAEQQSELQRERVLLENRLRFQQEHLEKVRLDLERAQNEFRSERQRERQQIEDDVQQLHRRLAQLGTHRRTLDELVRAVDREHDTALKCREAWASTVDEDRQTLINERTHWDEDRRRQKVELRRQQELLAQQAERLETRRLRLERLRAELEDTHRTTLELRLAVEEAWAQIAHAVGSDEDARMKVEQARQALVLYYQQLHAALQDHRRELSEQQAWFDQQRSEFHEERQTVLHWLNERDGRLRAEETRQLTAAADLAAHDTAWRATRDRWLSEKLEAERIIRRLVSELADSTLSELPGTTEFAQRPSSRAA